MCSNVSAFIKTSQTERDITAAKLKRYQPTVTSPRETYFLLYRLLFHPVKTSQNFDDILTEDRRILGSAV